LLAPKTLLIAGQEGTTRREENIQREAVAQRGVTAGMNFEVHDPTLVAYDKASGKVVGEVPLPRNATAAPMTYLWKGKQYIVVATGGANLPPDSTWRRRVRAGGPGTRGRVNADPVL
jgi:quinoprotein glucose dehydrogenase